MNAKNAKGNILIIDDEELLTESIQLLIAPEADKVYVAHSGEQGLEILKSHEVHCIVCDINMPGMNGVDVIKDVRENNIETPFIFYTAYGNQKLMLEAAKYGAFDFLDKPDLTGLVETLKRGLKKGLAGQIPHEDEQELLMNDFQKLVKGIQNPND